MKLPDISSKYGAPMGRLNIYPLNRNLPIKLRMVKLRMVEYAYDSGGAYWGHGTPLYWAKSVEDFETAHSKEPIQVFVRAFNRDGAKNQIKAYLPNAKFFR